MKIAQVAPLYESVPPQAYGGTERIVSYLTEELVEEGHEVTLFASGDSVSKARVVASCPRALRLDPVNDPLAYHIVHLAQVFERAPSFDLIHFHTDYLHFPLARMQATPYLTTLHGRLDLPDLGPIYTTFRETPVVSISNAQRHPLSWANWQGTVNHGLPKDLYKCRETPGRYLAFLGRIAMEKRPDRAIDIAKRSGMKLKIAAKVDAADRKYMDEVIRPLLDAPHVECVGEINDRRKQDFLGNAYALLFPIDWPEPFGLVLIEAMACGTPVIAYRCGSVPELVREGSTGFIVNDMNEALKALEKVQRFDRRRCREIFEQYFTVSRMAQDYLRIYHRLIKSQQLKDRQKLEKPRSIRPALAFSEEARPGK